MCHQRLWDRSGRPAHPWPSIEAPSLKRFRLSKCIVYQISYLKRGSWRAWKHGISRVGTSRPSGQISRCQTSMKARCRYVVKNRVTGWSNARSLGSRLHHDVLPATRTLPTVSVPQLPMSGQVGPERAGPRR